MMRFFVNPNGYGQVKVRLAYDGEILRTRADDDIRPLDPIDPSLVGRLRVAALLRHTRKITDHSRRLLRRSRGRRCPPA